MLKVDLETDVSLSVEGPQVSVYLQDSEDGNYEQFSWKDFLWSTIEDNDSQELAEISGRLFWLAERVRLASFDG